MEDEIILRYKIGYEWGNRIFGDIFIQNNYKKLQMKVNNEKRKIEAFYEIEEPGEIEITLIGIKYVTNMSYMFYECKSLSSLPDFSKIDTSKVTDMSYMFCKSFIFTSVPNISAWNTSNVKNMSHMFNQACFYSSLPDISKWNTSKVTDMSYMFSQAHIFSSLFEYEVFEKENELNTGFIQIRENESTKINNTKQWNNFDYIKNNISVCFTL